MREPTVPSQLIFLPGSLGIRRFWMPLQAELPALGEMILMSYPGFDDEPADSTVSSFDDLANLVVSRLTRPTVFIAQSMGGVLALEATLRRPELVTHLILIATSGGLDAGRYGAVDWRTDFRVEYPDLPDWFASYSADITGRLRKIDKPVLLLWGDRDPISPVAVGEVFLKSFPQAELHVIGNAGHDLAQTHAREIAPLIQAHLQIG